MPYTREMLLAMPDKEARRLAEQRRRAIVKSIETFIAPCVVQEAIRGKTSFFHPLESSWPPSPDDPALLVLNGLSRYNSTKLVRPDATKPYTLVASAPNYCGVAPVETVSHDEVLDAAKVVFPDSRIELTTRDNGTKKSVKGLLITWV